MTLKKFAVTFALGSLAHAWSRRDHDDGAIARQLA